MVEMEEGEEMNTFNKGEIKDLHLWVSILSERLRRMYFIFTISYLPSCFSLECVVYSIGARIQNM